ncbi:MAG: redoxin domain-containing protein, partial [Proteobacteria bacterium]|nr:redoxin domain-containing protein [Pseudomonadota bacterium]
MRRLSALLALLLASASASALAPNDHVDNFRLFDHAGQSHELYYLSDAKAVVFMVQGNGCPIVRNALPRLQEIRDTFESQGVEFRMINANLQDNRASIAKEANKRYYRWSNTTATNEYNVFFESGTRNPDGFLLANQSLDDLMNFTYYLHDDEDTSEAQELAYGLWKAHYARRFPETGSKIRSGIKNPDINFLVQAIMFARHGVEVYAASYDFRDAIDPLREGQELLAEHGLSITPMP